MHVAHGNGLLEEAKLHQERDELERVLESHAVMGRLGFVVDIVGL